MVSIEHDFKIEILLPIKKNKAKFATAFFFKVTPFSVRYKGAHGFHNYWKTVSASDSEPTTNLQAGHESCQ
jgi:hypothetical protein